MIAADQSAVYTVHEFGMLVIGIAYALMLGGVITASIILCGWHGVKSTAMSFFHGTVTILCRS